MQDLVAHWPFDTNADDAVGSHHGVFLGDARIATDPDRGQVLLCDGNLDYVEVPFSAETNPTEVTVAASFPVNSAIRSPAAISSSSI